MQGSYLSLLPIREVALIWGLNQMIIVKYMASSIHLIDWLSFGIGLFNLNHFLLNFFHSLKFVICVSIIMSFKNYTFFSFFKGVLLVILEKGVST